MDLATEYLNQDRWRDFERMLDRLPCSRGDLVLDLGCGPGTVSRHLAPRVRKIIGIDRDPAPDASPDEVLVSAPALAEALFRRIDAFLVALFSDPKRVELAEKRPSTDSEARTTA